MINYKPKVCLDTSIIVKWLKNEEDSDKALELRDLIEEDKINTTISILLLSEIARALKKARWEDEEICEALELLDGIIELCGIAVIPVDILIIKSAQNLIVNYGLYSADAIHTATAMLTESNYFVSSDEHHFKENLKTHLDDRGVKSLRLSEVDGIEIAVH